MPNSVYLDHAASSPLRPEAQLAWLDAVRDVGNASSTHRYGRAAKSRIETARRDIGVHLGATGNEIVFTSGASEANSLALHQAKGILIHSLGDHESLYRVPFSGSRHEIGLHPDGRIDFDQALSFIRAAEPGVFVALGLVNSETGVISDIGKLAEAVRAQNGWLHIDAVQALGRIPLDFEALGCHSMAVSAHKIGGPQGVGALVIERGLKLSALISGGGQEQGLRSGTENVAGICAFAAALDVAQPIDWNAAQSKFENRLKALGCQIMGGDILRVGGVIAFAQPHWESRLQLIEMDLKGFAVSMGSACSSGKVTNSRIITAMGFSDLADKTIRVSLGWTNRPDDLEQFYQAWSESYLAYLKRNGLALTEVAVAS